MPQPRATVAPFRRRYGAQPLADLVAPCIEPVLQRQGFSEGDVLMHWPEIVGEQLSQHCRPLKLQWPARARRADGDAEPATLIVRVEGVYALTLQHMAPVILQRVNVYFGWRCVGKLALRQGPLPPLKRTKQAVAAVDPAAAALAVAVTADIGDEVLRAALVGLGSKVLARAGTDRS